MRDNDRAVAHRFYKARDVLKRRLRCYVPIGNPMNGGRMPWNRLLGIDERLKGRHEATTLNQEARNFHNAAACRAETGSLHVHEGVSP